MKIKNLVTAFLLSLIFLSFCIAGCKHTAEPEPEHVIGGYYRTGVTYNNVDEFILYYNEDFMQKNEERMYFLNPTGRVKGDGIRYDRFNSFSISGDELIKIDCKFINPILYEEFSVYYEELGDLDGEQKILGKYSYSFKVDATFYPVSSMTETKKLQFEFDKESLTFIIKNGDEVIGECKFKTEIDITEEWYQNYIKTNLTYWG